MTTPRIPTAVDAAADAYLDAAVALDPLKATSLGVPGHDDELPDYSPDGYEQRSDLRRRTLAGLDPLVAEDANDRITLAALRGELELAEQLRDAGAEPALNNIESPLQSVRDIFDLTPTSSVEHWATIARRMAAVPAALEGYTASLLAAADAGRVAPRRQVEAGVEQCGMNAGPDGFFARLAAGAAPADGSALPDSVRADLARGAQQASDGYEALARTLQGLLDRAPAEDGCGRERYPLHLQSFLGARVDLEETYEWGQQELARIVAEQAATADRIRPGASLAEAVAVLDADPSRRLDGTDALREWMQRTSDAAVAALAGTHFDIPDEIRTLECLIAPTQLGGIYYTGPSEDLVTRPGRMWWSVPAGDTTFATWKEVSTVYHEGVPGHHLQIAQTTYRRDVLNRWRRMDSWLSGHGEGWALYAERLMAELGFLNDPADYLGMLDNQSLRAARVVIDIGFHCGFPAPAEVGGGSWTWEKAWDFLGAHTSMSEGVRRFELTRYLG
ncbi:DUF885 domain-containing protein, partial [Jatrophihabitans endophyticus]|uniref:DUF885 domain-containing protein n=1 Tax=Jatrophihabitans endophyticus TaxID=1206085 RepID=UPI0019F7D286